MTDRPPVQIDDLQRLVAERACERLMVDYAAAVDFGKASAIAELFTEDGVWEGADGRCMNGKAEMQRSFGGREALTRRTSRHVCTNIYVELVSADEAIGRCYLINYRHDSDDGVAKEPAPANVPKFVGEYHDRFVRTPDGWRFAHRRFHLTFLRQRTR